jgi:hypothetical protein
LVFPLPGKDILLLEAKLKLSARAVSMAKAQLLGLYAPLLQALFPSSLLRLGIVGRYAGEEGKHPVPLPDVRWDELGPDPLILQWDGKRRLGGFFPLQTHFFPLLQAQAKALEDRSCSAALLF